MNSNDIGTLSKSASVILHMKENHQSYLLGVLVLHLVGAYSWLQDTTGGCFP